MLGVVGNTIATTGVGITVGGDAVVDGNAVNGLGGSPAAGGVVPGAAGGAKPGTDGIVVVASGFDARPGHVRITGNRAHDRTGVGISLRTAVQTWMVKQNVVASAGAGILVEADGLADRIAVDNNEVFDIAGTGSGVIGAVGIGMCARPRPASPATPCCASVSSSRRRGCAPASSCSRAATSA